VNLKILENLSVILVIPDLPSKTKLREVLRAVLYKCEVLYERSIKDLEIKLGEATSNKLDLAFISAKYPHEEISAFLKNVKEVSLKPTPAIILTLPSSSAQSSGVIASWYLEGVTGFISEPYTAQDLADLLIKILEQRNKKVQIEDSVKSRKASNFLLTDAMNLVDEVARLSAEGKEGGYALRDLKGLSKNFAEHFAQDPKGYEDAIIEPFQKATPPAWAKGIARKKVKAKSTKHPGLVIWEMMSQRGVTEERLVELLRIDAATVTALIRGRLAVDNSIAKGLSRIFGMSPREWLRMQADFDATNKETKP
jgi:plasmid maintenance system antidote protein VapI